MERKPFACPKITLDERLHIQELLKQKLSITAMAKITGRSRAGLHLELKRAGGYLSYDAHVAHEKAMKTQKVRVEKIRKEMGIEEMKKLQGLMEKKLPKREIVRLMGKKRSTVMYAIDRIDLSYIGNREEVMEDKIGCLEMQIEIIIEQLKVLHDKVNKLGKRHDI